MLFKRSISISRVSTGILEVFMKSSIFSYSLSTLVSLLRYSPGDDDTFNLDSFLSWIIISGLFLLWINIIHRHVIPPSVMITSITTITVMNIAIVADIEVDGKLAVKNDSVEYVMSASAFDSLFKDSVLMLVEGSKVGVTSVIVFTTGMVTFE